MPCPSFPRQPAREQASGAMRVMGLRIEHRFMSVAHRPRLRTAGRAARRASRARALSRS